eukprot:TRINITY_DN19670_c0_g1_i1.p1 TRINITY_DN19670_c0_g1~~TRINITY_DN19670_c0_g1_i1.p1  ORF type:complete len:256 (-),score=54.86 TRINITY_DN19670_c0_g1_i1:12-755(-)
MGTKVKITPLIRSTIKDALKAEGGLAGLINTDVEQLQQIDKSASIEEVSISLLKSISKNSPSHNKVYLHQLLQGSALVIPSPPKIVPTAQQIRIRQELREKYEKDRYEKMTASLNEQRTKRELENREIASYSAGMSIGVNIIVTAITLFIVGYYLCSLTYGGTVAGVIGGVAFAIIGLLVETWLFIIRGDAVFGQQKKTQKRKTPRKFEYPPEFDQLMASAQEAKAITDVQNQEKSEQDPSDLLKKR